MRILSVDVSVNFVGWSLFDSKRINPHKQWKWGTIIVEGDNYQKRLLDIVQMLNETVNLPTIDHLITEWPTFFASERGQIAAHQNYTIDLAGVCAFIAGRMGFDHRNWHLLTATTWKGSVSKYITGKRFFRIFGLRDQDISEHAIDATMMLRYWLIHYGPAAFQRADEDFPESPLLRF